MAGYKDSINIFSSPPSSRTIFFLDFSLKGGQKASSGDPRSPSLVWAFLSQYSLHFLLSFTDWTDLGQ